jgi:hypothetical protein
MLQSAYLIILRFRVDYTFCRIQGERMWDIDDTKTMICSVLELFDSYGLLNHYLLIGGWAAYTHQQNTEGLDYLPNITTDLDFAIHPRIQHPKVPLVTELEKLGYETWLHQDSQVAKFKHPALDLEFLLTPTGRADKAIRYPPLKAFTYHVEIKQTLM